MSAFKTTSDDPARQQDRGTDAANRMLGPRLSGIRGE